MSNDGKLCLWQIFCWVPKERNVRFWQILCWTAKDGNLRFGRYSVGLQKTEISIFGRQIFCWTAKDGNLRLWQIFCWVPKDGNQFYIFENSARPTSGAPQ
jgi:hypothetical protein